MEEKTNMELAQELRNAVTTIKTAILQSQARAVKTVNQEQLACTMALADSFLKTPASTNGGQVL